MSAISAPDLALLRTKRHASQLYLAVHIPTVIWTARVNGTQSDGDTTITVDGVVQVRAPQANYQVLFGSTAGARDLGTARFKSYSVPTLTVGAHNSTLTDDAYVTILEFIPPEAVLVDISATDVVSEDGNIAYVSDNASKTPLARIGAPAVVWRDNLTGLGTINFFSDSLAIAPAATISTHAWNFRDGTPGTSALAGTTGAPIAVTFPSLGWRYVQYTTTDSNGTTHTRFNPVLVDDKANPQYCHSQIEIGLCEVNDTGSVTLPVTVHTNGSAADFPEGAQVIIFSDDYFDDVLDYVSLYPHRENIVAVGWIRAGSTKFDANHSTVEFRVESLGAIAANMTSVGGGLEDSASPTGWHQIKNLTHNLAAHHVLVHHTTLSQIVDVYPELSAFANEYIDLTDSNIADNLTTQIAVPTAGKFGCSLQGAIYLQPNQQLLALASRSTDYLIDLTTADLRDAVEFGDESYEEQVNQIDLVCDKANGDSWFSVAHQYQMPFGQGEHVEGYRADSQVDANILSGMLLASRNNSPKETIFRLRGNYRFLQPFPIQPITATFAASTNARGIAWSAQRCWVTRTTLQYGTSGYLLVDVTVEKDSSGPPGVTGDYPDEIPDPDYTPIIPVKDPVWDPIEPPQPTGKGNLLYVATLQGLAKCVMAYGTDGTDGAPVWSSMNGTAPNNLTGNALKIRAFNLDPFSVSVDHFTAGWAVTDDGFYRVTGLPNLPVWTRQLTNSDAATLIGSSLSGTAYTLSGHTLCYSFTPSVRKPGFVAILVYATTLNGGVPFGTAYYFVYSLDYGTTWNVDSTDWVWSNPSSPISSMVCSASSHIDDTYYISGYIQYDDEYAGGFAANSQPFLERSVGATINFHAAQTAGNIGVGTVGYVVFPYTNSSGMVYADDKEMYWMNTSQNNVDAVQKCVSAMDPFWNNTPTHPTLTGIGEAGHGWFPISGGEIGIGFFVHMFNENKMAILAGSQCSDQTKVWVSSTGNAPWTTTTPSAPDSPVLKYLFMIPIDSNIFFVCGKTGAGLGVARIYVTTDYGSNYTRIDNSLGGSLDTVMGLNAGDMDYSQIIVDYFKP